MNEPYLNLNSDSDSDDSDSDDSDSDDSDEDLVIYNNDEQSKTRFNLVLCELFNKRLHGSSNIKDTHYLIIVKIKLT